MLYSANDRDSDGKPLFLGCFEKILRVRKFVPLDFLTIFVCLVLYEHSHTFTIHGSTLGGFEDIWKEFLMTIFDFPT